MAGAPLLYEFIGRFGQQQFAEFMLDDDLPGGSDAQVDFISLPWNGPMVSAGNSSKNEAGTVNFPFARPMDRGLCRCAAIGRISAIGWFRLHNRMVSPCSTSSRYRDKWVLAVWMLIFFMVKN